MRPRAQTAGAVVVVADDDGVPGPGATGPGVVGEAGCEVVFDLVVGNTEQLDHDRLAHKMSLMPAESWVELGRGHRGNGVIAIREELVRRYNMNLKLRRI